MVGRGDVYIVLANAAMVLSVIRVVLFPSLCRLGGASKNKKSLTWLLGE